MGKYIIEIPEDKIADFVGSTHFLMPYMMAGHKGHHDTGLELTPYTEPDLERVKKTTHDDGYSEGYQAGREDLNRVMSQVKKDYDAFYENGYQRGLSDAWETARKIEFSVGSGGLPTDTIAEIFGTPIPNRVLRDFTASEVIEKIRKYEQEQEEKQHTWIFSEVNEPSVDTTLICSKCGYTITIKPGDTQALNFCPKCGDNKRGERDE